MEVGSKYESILQKLYDISGFVIPLAATKQRSLSYDTVGQRFILMGLIGLNKSSKEGELVRSF